MSGKIRGSRCVLLAVMAVSLWFCAGSTRAEVGVENNVPVEHMYASRIIEDSDPVGAACLSFLAAFTGNSPVGISANNGRAVVDDRDVSEMLNCLTMKLVGDPDSFIADHTQPVRDVFNS